MKNPKKTPYTASIRIRIRLYPQTFCYGYAFRPHVSVKTRSENAIQGGNF